MKVPRFIIRRLPVQVSLLHLQYPHDQLSGGALGLGVLLLDSIEELHGLVCGQSADVRGRGQVEPHLNIVADDDGYRSNMDDCDD